MSAVEANIDGLVGPTHNYAGLAFGNVASEKSAKSISNPKAAALQGLAKMKYLHDLGIPQMVMPPHPRPDLALLKRLGFACVKDAPPALLAQASSAAAMWVANAATISPSADTADGKVHITPANLISNLHRSIEPSVTAQYLKQIFPGSLFVHHDPLPAQAQFSDEGAANHMRLARSHGDKGTEIFVYGGKSRKYPSRQALQASQAIARLHGLRSKDVIFLEQSPAAIDAGVFHNDVIAMSNGPLFIFHEKAYTALPKLQNYTLVQIKEKDLPLHDAVSTYFFNSQLITLPEGGMAVIAPVECQENKKARACFTRLVEMGHVKKIHYLDVRESMKNGGGPACLRLRVVLTETERAQVNKKVWLDKNLYHALCRWIDRHYRDKIAPEDLRDMHLAKESERALEELQGLLGVEAA